MKLWNVTIEVEAVVLADSEEEARGFADEMIRTVDFFDDLALATPYSYLPAGWKPSDPVYHGGLGDITVEEAEQVARENAPPPKNRPTLWSEGDQQEVSNAETNTRT